jgi:hypothetical protein
MAERVYNTPWAFAEMAEDALVAFLAAAVPGDVSVRPCLDAELATFPAVIVQVADEENAGDEMLMSGARAFEGTLHIVTPGSSQTVDGAVVATPRQRHANLVSTVLCALAVAYTKPEQPYTKLAAAINAVGAVPGVAFASVIVLVALPGLTARLTHLVGAIYPASVLTLLALAFIGTLLLLRTVGLWFGDGVVVPVVQGATG